MSEANKDVLNSLSTADLAGELSSRLATTTDQSLLQQLISIGNAARARQEELAQTAPEPAVEPQTADAQANQGTQEQSQADEWAERIRESKQYFLMSKIDPNWLVGGRQLVDIYPEVNLKREGRYVPIGPDGVLEYDRYGPPRVVKGKSARRSMNIFYDVQREVQKQYKEAGNLANVLLISSVEGNEDEFEMIYGAINAVGDGRANPSVLFHFFLPKYAKEDFLLDLETNPDLVNEVYEKLFPGLCSEGQLMRKQASSLAVFEEKRGDYLNWDPYGKKIDPRIRILQLRKPVGEVAEPLLPNSL